VHRLFGPVIAPLIEALEPRRVIETGSGTGRLTERVLDAPGAQRAVLHAIDPAPRLDPGLLARAGERLEVHAERAIGAIGRIEPVDLALLDGDPNWYSVHSELTLLLRGAAREGLAAPLVVVHNVHWPFGRRDGYYDPATIPPAHLREHTQLGLLPGRRDPSEEGLGLTPWCARRDFEPRSGVLSAIEDVIAASELEWTVLEVPGFHGVAVMVEARRLAERPALVAVLEKLRSAAFLGEQARRAESARLAAEAALAEPAAAPEPASPAEPEPGLVAELESERIALLADLAEQRARRDALEWRLERLDADLRAQGRRLEAQAGERDGEREAAVEARVRLEEASAALGSERQAVAALREQLAALEKEAELGARELREVSERERLAQGRLAHREEALQASHSERERLAAEADRLGAELLAAHAQLEEIAKLLDDARRSRWARFRRWLRRVTRAATFRGPVPPSPLESARARAERALPAPVARPEPGDPRGARGEPEPQRESAG
jgi:hypothetical protein